MKGTDMIENKFNYEEAIEQLRAGKSLTGKDGILTINEILQFIEKVEPQPCFGEFGDNEPGSDFILIARQENINITPVVPIFRKKTIKHKLLIVDKIYIIDNLIIPL